MRKLIKSLALVAVAAMTLSACQKEVELQKKNADGLYEYSFVILEDGTKAVIGDSNIEWVTGDQVGMFVGSYKGYAKVDVTQTPRMVVLYSNQVIPAGTMAYAYSPYDGSNTDATNAKITLSEIQSGAAISAMPLAGIPFEVEEEVEAGNQEGNGAIKFLNLGSLINFKIYSSDAALQSETITSVKFEATKRLAGTGTLDLTAVDMNDEGTLELDFEGDDEIHFVKVDDQSVAVAASKDDATPIKMVVLPGTFEGTLTVTTNVATYTKAMPEREYVRSGLRTWGLDLTNAERVEGVEEVVKTLPYDEPFSTNKGDFSVENIVMPEGLTAVWTHGTHSTDSYMQANAYVGGTRYETESMLVSPWINLAGVTAAEVTFDNAYKYVSAPADYFTCWVKTDETGAEWVKKTIDDYGTGNFAWGSATIDLSSFVGKKVKVAFKYISGGKDTNTGAWEIKNFSAHIVKADPQISYERETWDVELGDETAVGQELTNPNNIEEGITYTSGDTNVVTVDSATGEITAVLAAGSSVITATFAGNDVYKPATASYTITVIDPSITTITDVLTRATTGVTGSSYTSWEGKTSNSDAVYAGSSAGSNSSIQLRSSDSVSGIITTASGGYATKVTVIWESHTMSGRTLNVYGSNSAYTSTSTLYSDDAGDLIGTIVYGTSTELTIPYDYKYIGLRSADGAMYLSEIDIVWSKIASGNEPPAVALSSIVVSEQTTSFTVGDSFIFDGKVTATYSNGTTADVTSSASVSAPDLSTEGEKTVTVSYTENGVTKVAQYIITVSSPSGGVTTVVFVAGTDTGDTSVTKDGITITMSTMSRDDNYRTYANSDMVVSAASGKTIKSVVVTCTGNGNSNYGPGKFSGDGYTASTGKTGTWTGSASTVTLSASAQVRMTQIEVSYE